MTRVTDTTIQVEAESAAAAFLVTRDLWYPGWRATVDGEPAMVFRTDYVVRGIELPAGRHTVSSPEASG